MIVGYGICGPGEADRYMRATLEEFKRLCDQTIIVLNNAGEKERALVEEYGFLIREDNREWGTNQHKIKEDLMVEVGKLNPTFCVCLDMDEVFDNQMSREDLIKQFEIGNALYFYIVNLWNDGWNRKWSFWNVRAWKWNGDIKFENRPLHCGLAPAWCYRFASYAPYYVNHYGLKEKESRQRKIERYNKYDPKAKYKDQSYYEALKSDHSDVLDYKFIREELKKEVGSQKKRNMRHTQDQEYYYIERNGRQVDIPAKHLQEHLSRGWKIVSKIGEVAPRKVDEGKTKIAYIGNFKNLWDEEYIARALEELGCEVMRITERTPAEAMIGMIENFNPNFVLTAKLNNKNAQDIIIGCKVRGIPTVSWTFDIYWGYPREGRIKTEAFFKADYVFTTDGGHDEEWKKLGINHITLRQGIHEPECYAKTAEKLFEVVFVGSNNQDNPERNEMIERVSAKYMLHWYGKTDTNEKRGEDLNELYSKTKIVIGDSFPSPHYWSNRVVETLGRGGFLIHREVEGIKEAYPNLVTYDGTWEDLDKKIGYYLKQNKRREAIIEKNLKHVKDNYTCKKMCEQLLAHVL